MRFSIAICPESVNETPIACQGKFGCDLGSTGR